MTTTTIPRRAWVEQIMGMPISLHLRGDKPRGGDPPAANARGEGWLDPGVERRVARVFEELRLVEAALSPYRDDSDLSRWERGSLPLDEADAALTEVIALCDEARERTDGWFDPRGLPDPRTGAPRYDPCGLVKGWAVERAARHLQDLDGCGWCLNAGGDIVLNSPTEQRPWLVGIEDPRNPARVMRAIGRVEGAVATSGTVHRGCHIIDPRTRRPATAVRAVTVIGPRLLWADVYATAAVARGTSAIEWLGDLDGYEALLVTASGLLRQTEGWPDS